jgi:DNA-binding beta-propeller fold protein YncE
VVDGRAELFAGGTPARGTPPLLRQPEAAAVDAAGFIYVADREQGVVVRLDPTGRVLEPQWIGVRRPRVLAADAGGIWIGADGEAAAPWQQGPGEIWYVSREGAPRLVLRGPVPQGIALSPGGNLFVTDRHAGQVFVVTPDGRRLDFARFTDGDAPRGLAFAPVTPETRRAGIAGDLFVVTINRGVWAMTEVVRISGAFDELVRERLSGAQ